MLYRTIASRLFFISLPILVAGLLVTPQASAEGEPEDLPPRWEIGAGLGVAGFEHYPACEKTSTLIVPVPIFKYRGSVIRADDREGTRARLLKENKLALDFSGGGWPGKGFSGDDARSGMDELPWILILGPQLVYNFTSDLKFKVGYFKAIGTDFTATKFNGALQELKLLWTWGSSSGGSKFHPEFVTDLELALSVTFADQTFLATYFDVSPRDVRPDRPYYQSVAGPLSYDETYMQTWAFKNWRVIAIADLANYEISANRASPLHKSDHNLSFLLALGYIIGESKQRAIPEQESEGVINVLEDRREKK